MGSTDFDGDGLDDIIWQNRHTGMVVSWLGQADGTFIFNQAAGFDPWAIGHLAATGDFDGDGRSDTIWRTSNGEMYLSPTYAEGAFYFNWSLGFLATAGADWQVAGTGDFDGDGKDDLLWRSAAGAVRIWAGFDEYAFQTRQANSGNAVPTDWQIVGTGDFDGDGRDDILWRHESGIVTNWLSRAAGGFDNNHVNTGEAIPTDWHVIGTGDFNGDGRADVLWRHDSGIVTNWLGEADGGFVNNHVHTGQILATDWRAVGTGDYNGDGRDDVLWHHHDGTITDWLGQADGGLVGNRAATGPVDPSWIVLPNLTGAGEWDY